MHSPIQNRLGMVFVPVSDLSRAIEWYSRILGVPVQEASHHGTIYNVPMQGKVGLILDATRPEVSNSSQPLCFFWTSDIHQAYEFLQKNDVLR